MQYVFQSEVSMEEVSRTKAIAKPHMAERVPMVVE
jgi:hypothetical protein